MATPHNHLRLAPPLRQRHLHRTAASALEPNMASPNKERLLRLLNEALATELACVLRYRRHYCRARDLKAKRIAEEFLVHSDEELTHADQLAERIVQLGGEPNFTPDVCGGGIAGTASRGGTPTEMLRDSLSAARNALDGYRGLIEFIGETDPLTRRLLLAISDVEAAHIEELTDLLESTSLA